VRGNICKPTADGALHSIRVNPANCVVSDNYTEQVTGQYNLYVNGANILVANNRIVGGLHGLRLYTSSSTCTICNNLITGTDGGGAPIYNGGTGNRFGIIGNTAVTYGTAYPTTGTWAVGDICWKTDAAAGGSPGWVCTTAGTSGVWKAMASLAA
jgi:hypothetical protein